MSIDNPDSASEKVDFAHCAWRWGFSMTQAGQGALELVRRGCYVRWMEFGILGPLAVWEDGAELELGAAKQRAQLRRPQLELGPVLPDRQRTENPELHPTNVTPATYKLQARMR